MLGISTLAFGHSSRADNSLWIEDSEVNVFLSLCNKLEQVKRIVGYGNFNLLSFDSMLKVASRYSRIEPFSKEEIAFMEKMFYENPAKYGFFGEKTVSSITYNIPKKEVIKIPHTGHYLFRGHSEESYERVIKDIGDSLFLTSGIRNIPKQMNLYFNKIKSTGGNITAAVHSLAPPAYSYHSIGDFDVGKKGWGYKNFTASFARTEEFWRLRQLSYISMRYTINNKDGVRFEPWHVKIV
jgi:zinc D-Ala-D-Ala carboxypeptidase